MSRYGPVAPLQLAPLQVAPLGLSGWSGGRVVCHGQLQPLPLDVRFAIGREHQVPCEIVPN